MLLEVVFFLAVPSIYPTSFQSPSDKHIISITLPKMVTGVVIHERRFIRLDLQNSNTMSSMCLECTILGPFGLVVLSNFKQQLFGLSSIQSYITRGKINVCICEFEYDKAQALSTPVAPPLSQLSQLPQMLQLSQMSQYSANHTMDMGGYLFGMSYGMPLNQAYDHRNLCQWDMALEPWDLICE
jgi:hypothetical protein